MAKYYIGGPKVNLISLYKKKKMLFIDLGENLRLMNYQENQYNSDFKFEQIIVQSQQQEENVFEKIENVEDAAREEADSLEIVDPTSLSHNNNENSIGSNSNFMPF